MQSKSGFAAMSPGGLAVPMSHRLRGETAPSFASQKVYELMPARLGCVERCR